MSVGLAPWELVSRLAIAAVLGGAIGLEREAHGRPAGFRTHILVSVGSALIMIVSMYGLLDVTDRVAGTYYDAARVAAQVVSGIGFLGAGTILREGATVRGLTTAASLWTVAGIGLAVGTGLYIGALAATAIVMIALMFLGRVERRWMQGGDRSLEVTLDDRPGQLAAISAVLGRHQFNIRSVEFEEQSGGQVSLHFILKAPGGVAQHTKVVEEIARLEGVRQVAFKD